MSIQVATFYHFCPLRPDAEQQQALVAEMETQGVKGTVLLTPEGVNATIAGPKSGVQAVLRAIEGQITLAPLEVKYSTCAFQPFGKAKVKLKPETISLGEPACPTVVGEYLDTQAWNALLQDPDAIIIDTRNDYEVHLGTFRGAVNPNIASFRELPDFVRRVIGEDNTRKIGTFCTGGIRCEKFTAWLLAEGYQHVYHLKGGILKYFEEVSAADNQWIGECFVFDDRIAVDCDLQPSQTASICPVCSYTLTPADRAQPSYAENQSCPYCAVADPYRPMLSRAQAAGHDLNA